MNQTPEYIFESVWYRKSVPSWKDFKLIAYDDWGVLKVFPDHLHFSGSEFQIFIKNIELVTYGCQGRDFINFWVKIEYEKDHVGLFADGAWAGWRGHFGGTRKILEAIKKCYIFEE